MKGVAITIAVGVATTAIYQLFIAERVERVKEDAQARKDRERFGPGDAAAGQRYSELMNMIGS